MTISEISNLMSKSEKATYKKVAKRENLLSLREMIKNIVESVNDNDGNIEDAKEILYDTLKNTIPFHN